MHRVARPLGGRGVPPRRRGSRARRLHGRALATVTLLAATGLVAVPPRPAEAAATCNFVDARSADTPTPWSQRRLQPERVWGLSSGRGITVAVIDSGVDARNPHLRGQVIPGGNALAGLTDHGPLSDCSGHGTMVAGIIVGKPLPGTPFHGVAPGAKVLSILQNEQVPNQQPRGDVEGMARSIRYAADHGAEVINISATQDSDNPHLRDAVVYALKRDVLIVAAAGNDNPKDPNANQGAIYYPAAYNYAGVLAVAAIDRDGMRSDVSHSGAYVDVAAPGTDIISTGPNGRGGGRYAQQSGTSFAAPFVAGVAALVRAYRPELDAAQVAERIKRTADPPPSGAANAQIGAGVVNPYAAVTMALPGEQGATEVPPTPPAARAALPDPSPPDHTLRTIALAATGVGGVVVIVVLALAVFLPRGKRRGWRPGRRSTSPPRSEGTPEGTGAG